MKPYHVIVSCEHGGNLLPSAYMYLFRDHQEILNTHKGYDIGALTIAHKMSDEFRAKLFTNEVSRLLIDCNRSITNSELFSEYTKALKKSVKEYIIDHYYTPYRNKVESYIINHIAKKSILLLSIHSFTPVINGVERLVDVGLLFDEKRLGELNFCYEWKQQVSEQLPDINVMLNVPYKGSDDGFTTYLRKKYSQEKYIGIELEINQKYTNTVELEKIIDVLIITCNKTFNMSNTDYLLNLP